MEKKYCGVFDAQEIICFFVMLKKDFINSSVADSTHKSLASKPDCISDGSHNWMCALTSLIVVF